MRGSLDPVTEAKIEAFAARRRRLIFVRGICSVFTILLALMSGLALLDYFVLMADELRWVLSAAAYLAAVGAAWLTCARLIWRTPDATELARLFEAARPDLREDLLSAVELGDPRRLQALESEDFKETLQKNVAARIRDVDVQGLLSLGRIKKWIVATAAVVGACALLFLIPGLRYDHLLLRSMLPMANLERISRVQITIREPLPPERSVPQGDVVPVRVELDGLEVKRVLLETAVPGKKAERIDMTPAGGKVWDSGIAVGREPVRWRVAAGDGLTRWYTLTAVARPEATAFHKTYTYPVYAKKAPRQVTEASGDLVELEGSTAEVEVQVNQLVKSGELRLEQSGKSSVAKLVPTAAGRLKASIPITGQGTYRVHLVAEATLFENRFSPQYEIRPMPDLVPKVVMEEPAGELIVPPDEVIHVRGSAKDDLGLKVVAQAVRINAGEWKEWVLKEEPGATASVSRRWDLYEMGVSAGDRVTTKLVAVDLKGGRAESPPVTIVITAPGFDPQRHAPLAAKEPVLEALVALRDAARAVEKKIGDATAAAGADELARKQALLTAAQDVVNAQMRADEVEARLKEALRLSRAGREADDLVLVGRLVRRLKDASLATVQAETEKNLKKADEAARRASALATEAEARYRDILAGEEAIAILNDLKDLARDEQMIHRQLQSAQQANDAKAWERLARRQGVVVNQLKVVEEVCRVLATRAERGFGQRASQMRQELEKARTNLEKLLGGEPGPALAGPSAELRRIVDWAWQTHVGLETEVARRAESQREKLEKVAETNADDVRRAVQDVGLAKPARAQLEGRATLEESRRDQDPFFVSDAGLAGRALQAVIDQHAASPEAAKTAESLKIVDRAFRVLETGHLVAELSSTLRELSENERWRLGAPDATSRQPKDWRWADERAKTLVQAFKAAGLPVELGREIEKNVRAAAGDQVRNEMAARSAPGRKPQGVGPAIDRIGSDVGATLSRLAPFMEQARKDLLKLVPSLHERLKILAEAAEKIQQKTGALAEKTPQQEPAATRPEARQLLETQQSLDKQIEDVVAELRRDANTQDLFTEQGREKARDADDAIAMLKQSPPKAEDLLQEAAAAPQKQAQEHALEKAAEQQGKLADALETLAKHYENAAKGQPEETRPELRKAEEALGIKPQLDAQYRQMEKLAELAKQSPEALKAALTDELKKNEAMQRELAELTQNALDKAQEKLQQSAQMEKNTAEALQQAAKQDAEQKAQAQKGLAAEAKKLAEEARRMAKEDVAKLPQAQAKDAQKDLNEGAQAAEQATKPTLENAAKEFNDAAKDLQAAQQAAQQSAQKAQEAQQKESTEAAQAQQKAQQEQNQAAAAQKAAESAKQAQQAAEQAAKMAQDAAKAQPQNAEAQKQAQQAAQKAQQAQKQAQEAQAAAQKESAEAAQAQQKAQAEKAQADQAQQAAQQAQQQAQAAGQEAADAQQLAQKAQQLAQQATQAEAAQNLAQQAQKLAAEAKRMAQQDVQQLAQKSPAAQPSAQAAQQDLNEGAQAAAEATPQGLEKAAQEFNDAAKDLQAAQQAAQQAAAKAQQAAAQQPQNAQAQQAAQQAQQAAQAAGQEAADAQQLAQQAQGLAAQAKAQAQTPAGQQLQQAARTQQRVGEMLQQAQGDLQQAAENQKALGQPEESATTSQVAQGVEGIRQNEVPAAQTAAQSSTPSQASQAAQQAQAAIQKQAAALAQAKAAPASSTPGSPSEGSPLSEEASEFLAQALNELNGQGQQQQQGQGQPPPGQGQQPGQQGQAQDAVASAAQAQAQAMKQQRSQAGQPGQPGQPGQQPSQSPFSQAPGQGKGAQVEAGPLGESQLPGQALLKPGEWGKLPPKLARDLMEAQREGVSGEYRAMVETYFRVIAERARK